MEVKAPFRLMEMKSLPCSHEKLDLRRMDSWHAHYRHSHNCKTCDRNSKRSVDEVALELHGERCHQSAHDQHKNGQKDRQTYRRNQKRRESLALAETMNSLLIAITRRTPKTLFKSAIFTTRIYFFHYRL